jgi:hypothetical protein
MKSVARNVWVIFPFTIPWRYVFETYVKAPGDRWN